MVPLKLLIQINARVRLLPVEQFVEYNPLLHQVLNNHKAICVLLVIHLASYHEHVQLVLSIQVNFLSKDFKLPLAL